MLLSGGLDSAACTSFFVGKKYHVEGIHFNYGQSAAELELLSAQAIAKHYSIKLHHYRVPNAQKKGAGHIIGRNAFLLFAALLEFPWDSGFLQSFPYIGPVTAFHLAKNLGLDMVKPDRHLIRAAKSAGISSPQKMCQIIHQMVGDSVAVIDIVIWRYATINPQYMNEFEMVSPKRCY